MGSAVPLLIKTVQKDFGPDLLFLSPDKGGKRRTGIFGVEKQRINSFKVKVFSPKINLKEKTIAVVDDIIETGGTLSRFCQVIRKAGAKRIIILATHGVLPSGIKRIKKNCSKLYLTNSVEQPACRQAGQQASVNIANLISQSL